MDDLPNDCRRAVLLLGPTGSGKSPLGNLIEARGLWNRVFRHFDFGANLRAAVRRDQPDRWLSRQDLDFLHEVLVSGALLEDERFPLAQRVYRSFLEQRPLDPGTWIALNGLPRHVGQARSVDGMLHIEAVIHLQCSAPTVLARIESNIGGDRTRRDDDSLPEIRNKLQLFTHRTAPLLDHYRDLGRAIVPLPIEAQTTPEAAWQQLQTRETGQV